MGVVGVAGGDVGEGELLDVGAFGDGGGVAGGGVAGFDGAVGFVLGEGGFVDEEVGAFGDVSCGLAGAAVAGEDDLSAGAGGADKGVWGDDSAVVQGDGFAFVDAAPEWAFRDAEFAGQVGVESAQALIFDEGVAERGGAGVFDREGDD